jgi:hypothetical protein
MNAAGGGIFADMGALTLRSSIVAGNSYFYNGSIGIRPNDLRPGSGSLTITNSLIGSNFGTSLTATGPTPDATGNLIGANDVVMTFQEAHCPGKQIVGDGVVRVGERPSRVRRTQDPVKHHDRQRAPVDISLLELRPVKIGFGADERGKKGVVHIDDRVGISADEFLREDLHISRQYDQIHSDFG